MFARPGQKRSGAWCGSFRGQSYKNGERVLPLVTICGNFTRPVGDKPALLTTDEVETFFHEFGHGLASLLKDVKYKGMGGYPRDFVELPSQINEHWAFEPEVLKVYAKHYQTGEVIPQELVDKMVKAGKYGQGFATVEYLAASYLDMDYHVLTEIPADLDVEKFEAKVLGDRGLLPQIPSRYRSTYFNHTFNGGYTAGYYSYIWAEVLDADAYDAFVETGDIFNQEVANKYRTEILERAGEEDAMDLYINFRGKEPGIDPLLKNRGLK
jgi:peptidyl-dipeptidase Dcp